MILYNVTVAVDREVEEEWINWMSKHHIPDVMATGHFTAYKFFRVLGHDDPRSSSFSIQYFADTMDNLEAYQKGFAKKLQQEHHEKFADKYVAFRTLLEAVK